MSQVQHQIQMGQAEEQVRALGGLLAALGWDEALHRLRDQIPDARERLAYVAQMTDAAAHKVLNLVDDSQPACEAAAGDAAKLALRLAAQAEHPELGVGEARAALAEAAITLGQLGQAHRHQAGVLSQIMLAQDFQDLSGQVIKKVVGILANAEAQLLQLLAQSEGPQPDAAAQAALAGPQAPDKAVAQEDVDDLLASMGF